MNTKKDMLWALEQGKFAIEEIYSISTAQRIEECYDDIKKIISAESKLVEIDQFKNEPLTWEELKQMDAEEWVWIVFPHLPSEENMWAKAGKMRVIYSYKYYGKTWVAYRHKCDAINSILGNDPINDEWKQKIMDRFLKVK